MSTSLHLHGDTVYMRLLAESDAEALLAYKRKNRAFFEPFQPTQADDVFTIETQRRVLQKAGRDSDNDAGYMLGVFTAQNGPIIGHVSLSNVSRGVFQNANLGYALDESHNGQGYTTEAVRLTVRAAFDTLGLHRIQAAVMPRNLPSVRVLEKSGFIREGYARRYLKINGVWEDHLLFAVTSEDNGR